MVAASGSCTGRIPASALQPPGGRTRRPHRAGGGFQAGRAMAGSGHGPLSCGAPDRSAVVPETSPAAFDRLFARAADCSQGNSPCRHKGSPFLHFALPDPAPDRKHQPLSARRGWSSMALVDRRLSTPPAMTGGAAHHPQSHGQPGRTASPAPPRTGPAFSCQRGGSGLRPVSAPVGALRHLPAALPVRQTVPSPARPWHGCPLPWVDTLRSLPPTSGHPRRQRHRSIPEPETGSHPARQKAGDCYGRHIYAILAEDQLTA